MWSCKCDMAVMSCSTGGSSFSVSRLVNPPQPQLCLVTLRLASSLSLISVIIASYDVIKIVTVENVTLILFLCILVPYPSLFSNPTPLPCYCVCFMRCMHISQPLFICICLQFLTASCGFVAYMSLPCPPFLQYAIYESAGERARATLVIQCAHPHGPRLRGVHVLMKK